MTGSEQEWQSHRKSHRIPCFFRKNIASKQPKNRIHYRIAEFDEKKSAIFSIFLSLILLVSFVWS